MRIPESQQALAQRLLALSDDYGAELWVSQDELAIFVGATREAVNRQLQAWKRKGFLETSRNRIRLLDKTALAPALSMDGVVS